MQKTTDALAGSQFPRLLSVDHAAEVLGISSRHLRALAGRGRLRLIRLGRRVLVPREEIDRICAGGPQ